MNLDQISDSILNNVTVSLVSADKNNLNSLEISVSYKETLSDTAHIFYVVGYIYFDRGYFRIRGNREFENKSLGTTVKAVVANYLDLNQEIQNFNKKFN